MEDHERELHVVFGSGQVGSLLARNLLDAGNRVRVVKRSPVPVPDGVELVLADAMSEDACRDAAAGARVVYHCMNPPYSASVWEKMVPRFMANLVTAAGATDARLVVLDNLYMIGRGSGGRIDEDTPMNPTSRKGEIRARVADRLFAAHERGIVRAVCGRASDFYGPGGVGTHFGDLFWRAALRGKPAMFLPNPDTPHTYHYIPDVAAGLATLGGATGDVLGRVWMLPCAPAEPSLTMVARFSRALGRDIRLRGMPRIAVRTAGLFIPVMREVGEMLYQWDEPFVVDDTQFRKRFGAAPTHPDDGAPAMVEWARATYGENA